MKLNDTCPWKKSYDSFSRHRIKKQRQRSSKALPTKVHLVKAMVFPLAKRMWESDHKEGYGVSTSQERMWESDHKEGYGVSTSQTDVRVGS